MSISETAQAFFEACESGKGWEGCKSWCHDDASFACQSDVLAEVDSLAGYCDWMQGLLGPLPDGRYDLKAFAVDEDRGVAVASAVFHGTHSGEGGPCPPTGNSVAADYVYAMEFDGGKIKHMTKIWNDIQSLRALGWA